MVNPKLPLLKSCCAPLITLSGHPLVEDHIAYTPQYEEGQFFILHGDEKIIIRGRNGVEPYPIGRNLFALNRWYPISTSPVDDTVFWAGAWDGEHVYGKEWEIIAWRVEPVWIEHLTHYENPRRFEQRGWNHRNGPFPNSHEVKHWRPHVPLIPPPISIPIISEQDKDMTHVRPS